MNGIMYILNDMAQMCKNFAKFKNKKINSHSLSISNKIIQSCYALWFLYTWMMMKQIHVIHCYNRCCQFFFFVTWGGWLKIDIFHDGFVKKIIITYFWINEHVERSFVFFWWFDTFLCTHSVKNWMFVEIEDMDRI